MRSIKILIIVWGIFLVYATSSFAQYKYDFKSDSEPDGFRGIKWGTDLSSLSGMKYSYTDEGNGEVKYYLRTGDELKIGGANVSKIDYIFWKGKLGGVVIFTEGFGNFKGLKDAIVEKFGKGGQANKYRQRYVWGGEQTCMLLEYDEVSEIGSLTMLSEKIDKQREAENRQKAKEGAKKGF